MRTRKTVKRGPHVLARLAATESRSQLNLFCRHPWLLAWPHATNLGLSAARPPTLRVCARAVRATRRPRAHGSLPYGQPSAPGGLRIRAYGSPLARSAFGRVLSPPYAAAWPNARFTGGAWSACVTPGQRRTPYAWSTGLLRYPGCPRTSSPSASAGGKGTPADVTPTVTTSHKLPHPRLRFRHAAAPQKVVTAPLETQPHLLNQQP